MEFKGTKGKWKVIHTRPSVSVVGTKLGGKYLIAELSKQVGPEYHTEWNQKENQEVAANAQLISKAPELLDFLFTIFYSENTPVTHRKRAKQLIEEITKTENHE